MRVKCLCENNGHPKGGKVNSREIADTIKLQVCSDRKEVFHRIVKLIKLGQIKVLAIKKKLKYFIYTADSIK